MNVNVILHTLQHRSGRLFLAIARTLKKVGSRAQLQDAMRSISVDLVSAAGAHSIFIQLKTYSEGIACLLTFLGCDPI
jgi:hypothetical protein